MKHWYLLIVFLFPLISQAQEWRVIPSGVTTKLRDVFFINHNVGWVVGDDSTILKTSDGGETWISIDSGPNGHYEAVWFTDEDNGWIAGGGSSTPLGLAQTTDGGLTWERIDLPEIWRISDIQFVGKDTGWAMPPGRGPAPPVQGIYKTTNGGSDWFKQGENLTGVFKACSFSSNLEGWIVGGYTFTDIFEGEMIYHTSDGGETWEQQDAPTNPINTIHILESGIGFAYGWGPGIRTTDAGSTWNRLGPAKNSTAVFALDARHIYLARSNPPDTYLYVSSDTGITWRAMDREFADGTWGIFFVDSTLGFAVGTSGKIWKYDPENVGIEEVVNPLSFHLSQNYPNPFNPSTEIRYAIPGAMDVKLSVFDKLGRLVKVLVNDRMQAGSHSVQFNTEGLPSGMYIYRIETAKGSLAKKMLLMK
jgi:photosystem II stability/assembly factor-like uncharacterized protein